MVFQHHNSTLQLGNSLDSRILQTLYEFKMLGFHEVNEALIANSLGYRNPNNTMFVHSVRNLLSQRLLQKNPMGHLGLSETALTVFRILINAPSPSSTNDWQQRAQTLMGGFLPPFFPTIWQKLCDGQSHTIEGLAASVGRCGTSQNLRSIVKAMKYLGLVEPVGRDALRLSDIAFPFGRP
jgi:hypothetical protein